MKEDTSRADCDHEEIADHRAELRTIWLEIGKLHLDLDALQQRVNLHILEPCATQNETANLRILVRMLYSRVEALEAGKPRPPEGGSDGG